MITCGFIEIERRCECVSECWLLFSPEGEHQVRKWWDWTSPLQMALCDCGPAMEVLVGRLHCCQDRGEGCQGQDKILILKSSLQQNFCVHTLYHSHRIRSTVCRHPGLTWVTCRSAGSCTPTGSHCSWSSQACSPSWWSLMRSCCLWSFCLRQDGCQEHEKVHQVLIFLSLYG